MNDDASDFDPTLAAWFRSLTPRQRLEAVQAHAHLIIAARGLERVLADRDRDDRLLVEPDVALAEEDRAMAIFVV